MIDWEYVEILEYLNTEILGFYNTHIKTDLISKLFYNVNKKVE